jgi:hypothetical protein
MKILGKIIRGRLALSDYNRRTWDSFLKDPKNEGRVIAIQDRVPESLKQRAYYEGAVIPLWAYLNDYDFKDADTLGFLRETAKKEFNGEITILDGKKVIRGKSTKGLLGENDQQSSGFLERVISYLEENYGIDRNKVLNPEHYKTWRDEIFSFGEHESYIEYLQDTGFLKKNEPIK